MENKQEKIGNVTLDYTWYPGEDLYSDGDEEERLLRLVSERPEAEYDRVIEEEGSWAVLYHLSHVRENILGGIPVGPADRVLEIGAGCGAVTGALLGRCASLTCVDLSRRRSTINATRHRDKAPYTILVGNFQDIEPNLPKYDLITLIGVFEYARSYISAGTDATYEGLARSDEASLAYTDFLRRVAAHLAPGGRIVIAIENRLGMKYFAGSAEDHTGVYFDGIEDYPDEHASARTFSRPALEKIFASCGFRAESFAYPYPDYKLPCAIYSDDYLPAPGELRRNRWNFDRKRLEILDEDRTVDAIIRDGLYPQFANSFLVSLVREEVQEAETRPVYTKFSDERSEKYALKTQIFYAEKTRKNSLAKERVSISGDEVGETAVSENENDRGTGFSETGSTLEGVCSGFVRKTACSPAGNAHIQGIAWYSEKLAGQFAGTDIYVNRVLGTGSVAGSGMSGAAGNESGSAAENEAGGQGESKSETRGVRLAYVDLELLDCAETLEQKAQKLNRDGRTREALELIREVCGKIASRATQDFTFTEEFASLFGREDYPWEDKTLPVMDIDMVAENLICRPEGGYTLLDYEWTYECPIPLRFVQFRIWHYFAVHCFGEENAAVCCAGEGFTQEEMDRFLKMEAAWQAQVRGACVPLRELYGKISPGFADAKAALGIRRRTGETEFVSTLSLQGGLQGGECAAGEGAVKTTLRLDSVGHFAVSFDLEELLQRQTAGAGPAHLRWDPLENVICRVRIKNVRAAALAKVVPMNGYTGADGWDSFFTMDPVYDIELDLAAVAEAAARGKAENRAERALRLVIEGELETVNLYDELEQIDRIKAERDAYLTEMENLRRRIEAIRSTKAYKATEGLRRARNFTMARVRGTKMFRDKNAGPKKYQEWLAGHRADERTLADQRKMILPYMPKISILVPVYHTPEHYLREMIESVLAQSYGNWELCIADASTGENAETAAIVREYAARDPRIKLKILTENGGISANTNAAAELAAGEYITLLDHDDLLAADALFEAAQAIARTGADMLYTDEDKVNMLGTDHFEPNLKPEFSPDLLRSHNYITHLLVVRRNLFESVGRFDSRYDGAQDYDLILRCSEKAERIVHIPRVLYHWRSHESSTAQNPESKLYAYEAGCAALQAHLDRLGLEARAKRSKYWGINRTIYPVAKSSLVSVIIPNKDHVKDLDRCLTSIFERSSFQRLEVIVVENNSEKRETFAYYEQAKKRWDRLRVVTYEGSFNYSKINNFGVAAAKGDLLLLLNNDTQLIRPGSIREMAGIASRPDVGCVGAKLLYADRTVQHAGIVLGFGGFAGHVFVGIDADSPGFMMRPLLVCNYSAVTAACMMVRRSVYEELGGLNEDYAVALNDVDFCLRAGRAGYLNVYTPYSLWYHFESQSRGYEDTPEKKARLEREVARFRADWGDALSKPDPWYNPNFSLEMAPFSLY